MRASRRVSPSKSAFVILISGTPVTMCRVERFRFRTVDNGHVGYRPVVKAAAKQETRSRTGNLQLAPTALRLLISNIGRWRSPIASSLTYFCCAGAELEAPPASACGIIKLRFDPEVVVGAEVCGTGVDAGTLSGMAAGNPPPG